MYGDVVDFLVFEKETSREWPFAVPFDRITMNDLERIVFRLDANGFQREDGTEQIYGCCRDVLGDR